MGTRRGRQWIARKQNSAGAGGPGNRALLSFLPGGPAQSQIANPGGVTTTNGTPITCTRSTVKYCRTGTSGDASNLCPSPDDFSAAFWTKIASGAVPVVTADALASPDGTLTADSVAFSAQSTSNYSLIRSGNITATASPYTASVYVWSATAQTIYLSANSGSNYTPCALAAGAWTRCVDTRTLSAAAFTMDIGWNVVAVTPPATTVYLWGAKFEASASATPYISPMLRLMPINVPSVEPEGLLVGGPSTNTTQWSQDLTNAAWSKTGSTATSAAGISPDGTLTGSRLQLSAASQSASFAIMTSTYPTPSGQTMTVSGYVRSNTGSNQTFALRQTYSAVADYFSPDKVATTVWQRFSFTQVFPTNASTTCTSGLCTGAGSMAADLQVWGMQYEVMGFPSSYIATTTGATSRSGDVCSIPNPLTSPTAFAVGVTAQPQAGAAWSAVSRVPMGIGQDSLANTARFVDGYWADYDGTSGFAGLLDASVFPTFGTIAHRIVGAKTAQTVYQLSYDGVSVGTTTGTGTGMTSQPALIYIGGSLSNFFWGWVRDVRIGKTVATVK